MSDVAIANAEEQSYDQMPYDSHPHFQAQPARMAAAAKLFGLQPPDVRTARVLELGCAAGGNIIPLAERYSEASFLGVDVSGVQIAQGLTRLASVELKNIELRKCSIGDLSPADGTFDYIICHGVFSWVPEHIREAILRICSENLSETGVAYISYNALPGWHLKSVVRDMMKYHTRGISDPTLRVAESRTLIYDVAAHAQNAYGQLMQSELQLLGQVGDYYVDHEYLETENKAFYFTDFIADAERAGLAFLSEAEPTFALPESMNDDLARRIRAVAGDDCIRTEQYFDFYGGRQFHSTLLVKAPQGKKIRRIIDAASLEDLHFFPRAVITQAYVPKFSHATNLQSGFVTFTANAESITVSSPVHIRALEFFERASELHPGTLTVDELVRKAVMPAEPTAADRTAILTLLVELLRKQMIWFFAVPIPAQPPSDRPKVSRLAIADAAAGRTHTVSLMHDKITITNADARLFLQLFDGTRDIPAIERAVLELFQQGKISIEEPFRKLEPTDDVSEILPGFVASILANYAKVKMLT